jgi:hypothetical protein
MNPEKNQFLLNVEGVDVCNTETLPGAASAPAARADAFPSHEPTTQMFTSIVRRNIGPMGLSHKQVLRTDSLLDVVV